MDTPWRPAWPGMKPSYGYDLVERVLEPMLGVTLTREQADAIVEHLRYDLDTGLLVSGAEWWTLGATSAA